MEATTPSFRLPAPTPDTLVRLPPAFGTRFMVAVDVEEEFDWGAPLDRRHRSTTALAALPDAHRRFHDAGVGLACMVDHPVAVAPAARDLLEPVIADPRAEVGAQLHAWVTPPHREQVTSWNSFQGNLDPDLEAAKIDGLTDVVTALSGRRPRVFRAGRYGLGPATHRLLADRGYRLDLSPRARFTYADQGGPDFTRIGNAPWRAGPMVVLPASTIFTGRLRRWGDRLYPACAPLPRGHGVLSRLGLLSRVPLTPEGVSVAEAIGAIDAALRTGERLLLFGFHSPSLVPGHTPYVRDASDLTGFWHWWDRVLAHLARHDVRNVSVGELLAVR